ncbi:TetR/AcrR family transcriptional regulator [Maricaulis sp.]|uniref:TetR/AcrR family transcriptional regulator n=1 Tax=Maricaulis sp. TaxID=1486257 RepID=UPI002614534E|nr:TetR/AcrR family transcriptional regulator [Maricaulis sp.]
MTDGRTRILDASLALFTERSFDAVSIRDIGERAGLTNPALYQHFRGKQALGEALYMACYARLIDAMEAELNAAASPLENMASYVRASVKLHGQRPSPLPFLEDHQRLFGKLAVEHYGDRAISKRLASWARAGQQDGSIRSDIPVSFIVGLTIGQLTKWIMLSQMDLAPHDDAAEHLITLMRAAIGTR